MRYSKLCCKCQENHKEQEYLIGEYDLVLFNECYIDILVNALFKTYQNL